jgi:hypothetical protein
MSRRQCDGCDLVDDTIALVGSLLDGCERGLIILALLLSEQNVSRSSSVRGGVSHSIIRRTDQSAARRRRIGPRTNRCISSDRLPRTSPQHTTSWPYCAADLRDAGFANRTRQSRNETLRDRAGSVPSSGGNSRASFLSSTTAWTLPPPWTEEHRPPRLGNHRTVSTSAHPDPVIRSPPRVPASWWTAAASWAASSTPR